MGQNVEEMFEDLINEIRSFNNDPDIVDQRAKALVITKLEEAEMWFRKMVKVNR